MRLHIPYTATALGLVLIAGTSAAHAQTVITRQITDQPVETVQTIETIRTVRPAARRQIVTTRTITRQRIVPTPTVAQTVTTVPQPLYDEAAPMPVATNPDYSRPLYDEVVPASPGIGVMPVAADSYTTPVIYRYVYEPDRILVIDPNTNVAVQALPR
jgi:hypothetical protein